MVPSPESAHRRRLPLLLILLLTTTSTTSAAVSDVYQLPSETFTLLAPSWLWKGHGFVNDSDAVFWTGATGSLCDCTTRCFMDVRCVSLSYDTTDSSCRLNTIRGHPTSTQPQTGVQHRIRPKMAAFGDWCEADTDCALLTSGRGRCVANTCLCPAGEQHISPTECGPADPTTTPATTTRPTTTTVATPQPPTTTTTTTTPPPVATTQPAPTPVTTSTTTATTTQSTTTVTTTITSTTTHTTTTATSTTTATTTTVASTTTPTTTTTAAATPTTIATTTTVTTPSTTVTTPTTTVTTPSTTVTTPTTTVTTPTTTVTTPTTTVTTPTTTVTTPTTTVTTPTTTVTTPTTTITTTQTTTVSTTTPGIGEPVTTAMEALGTPVMVAGSTGTDLYAWVCGSHTSGTTALIGLMANGGQGNQLAGMQCADFSTMPGFTLRHADATHLILSDASPCPSNSIIVAIQDSRTNANTAIEALCVPVDGGYVVDCSTSVSFTFQKDVPLTCPTYFAVTDVTRDPTNRDPWKTMTCCEIVPA